MNDTMETLENLPQEEVQQEQPIEQVEQQQEEPSKRNDDNIRALRESKQQAERERDEYLKRLQEYESAKEQPKQERSAYNDDDLIEGRHLKELEARLDEQRRVLEGATIEARVKAQYPDFDKIVNNDSINRLRQTHPELAATIASSSDLYNKAASAYTLIKQMGFDGSTQAQTESVQSNVSKPRPNTQSTSPLTQANAFSNGLTDDLKRQLYKEMMDIRKHS